MARSKKLFVDCSPDVQIFSLRKELDVLDIGNSLGHSELLSGQAWRILVSEESVGGKKSIILKHIVVPQNLYVAAVAK